MAEINCFFVSSIDMMDIDAFRLDSVLSQILLFFVFAFSVVHIDRGASAPSLFMLLISQRVIATDDISNSSNFLLFGHSYRFITTFNTNMLTELYMLCPLLLYLFTLNLLVTNGGGGHLDSNLYIIHIHKLTWTFKNYKYFNPRVKIYPILG